MILRPLLSTIPLALSLLALGVSLVELRSILAANSLPEVRDTLNLELATHERSEITEKFADAASMPLAAESALLQNTLLLRGQVSRLNELNERIDLLCHALSQAGNLLRIKPYESRYLIYWAELRQALGRYECKLPASEGDILATLEYAISQEPISPRTLYSAALVYHWAQKPERALELFGSVVRLQPNLPEAWSRFISAQIKDPADFETIVPAKFPQVATWSKFIIDQHPYNAEKFQAPLSKVQQQALKSSKLEFERGELEGDLYLMRLHSLDGLIFDRALRSTFDSELSKQYLRLSKLQQRYLNSSKFFARRAKLSELAIVRAYADADSRTTRGQLSDWNSTRYLAFDSFYQSIGFFLGPGQQLGLIEITSLDGDARIDSDLIEVLVSDDNLSWSTLEAPIEKTLLNLPDRSTLALFFDTPPHKFYKINFSDSQRPNQFHNNLTHLVNAWGIGR